MGRHFARKCVSPGPQFGGCGAHTRQRFQNIGIPSCGECKKLARQMDEWGPAECRRRLHEIVEQLFERARTHVASLRIDQQVNMLRRWEAGPFDKLKAAGRWLVNRRDTLRCVLIGILTEAINAAEQGLPLPVPRSVGPAAGDSSCCCHCQASCTPVADCSWNGTTCGSFKCLCATITAISTECACLEGSYTLTTGLLTTHTYGYFEAQDPCTEESYTFTLTMDSDDQVSPCTGCSGDESVIRVSCGGSSYCIPLCGETDPMNLEGEGNVCCGCISVQVYSGACA